MIETNIAVQVHALQPRWIEHEQPKYRLYVNDDLITERTWIWDMQTFIEENICVCIEYDSVYTVRIEIIKSNPMHLAQFGLKNLKINERSESDHGGHRSELSFVLVKEELEDTEVN
jgi:hypothetical protein